jgi:hypothetical protein
LASLPSHVAARASPAATGAGRGIAVREFPQWRERPSRRSVPNKGSDAAPCGASLDAAAGYFRVVADAVADLFVDFQVGAAFRPPRITGRW